MKRSLIILMALLLVSCANYNSPKPAPLVNFQPTVKVQKQWSRTIGKGTAESYLKLTPVVVGNTVFADAYTGEVMALNAQTGRTIWKINTRLDLTSGLAAANGMVFVGTSEGQIVAIKQQDGAPGWWAPMVNEVLATPVTAGNKVLVKDESGALQAFTTNNGKLLWTYTHDEPSLILRGSGSPRVFGNYAIAGFSSGNLVKLRLSNGSEVWNKAIIEGHGVSDIQRMVDIDVDPQIINGIIYVATYQGKIAAVNLTNGQMLWHHELSSYSGLAIANNTVYVSDDVGDVWAFDTKTGGVVWKQNALSNRNLTAPAIIGNNIVVGDAQGYLHFMSQADGNFVARVRVARSPIIAPPVVVGNNVYAYTSNGKLVKYKIG